jgi:hypothetical protein
MLAQDKAVTANPAQWCLRGLAVAVIWLVAMVQASAQGRIGLNNPNIGRITPMIVHPGRFAGPDSVRLRTVPPDPVIVVDMDPTEGMATAERRARRKHGGKSK